MHNDRHWIHPRSVKAAAFFLLASVGGTAAADVDAPTADVTDDGNVNILDISALSARFGLRAGEAGYREGLDLVPDGIIDLGDLMAVVGQFGRMGVATEPTTFRGRVFDGLGNALPKVKVKLGLPPGGVKNSKVPVVGFTDEDGRYWIPVPPGRTGEKLATFDGSSAVDPTPDFLSGQYPTIPNKPVFVNGGIDNVFRDISLPERDLEGSVDL